MRYAFLKSLANNRARLDQEEYRHQVKVLRRGPGEQLQLLDGRGKIYKGRIERIEHGKRELEVVIEETRHCPPPRSLELIIALPRAGRFDGIIQKAVELGVTGIQPLCGERSQVRLNRPEEREKKLQHWEKIAIASCKQSGNPYLPWIGPPVTLARMDLSGNSGWECLVLHPDEDNRESTEPTRSLAEIELDPKLPTRLAFGPEGGFSRKEIELFRARGYRITGLGRRILRLETAVVAALVLVQARKQNF